MIGSKLNYLFLIALVIIFSGRSFSQQKLNLTVDQAVEIGLKNSKTLHSSLMKVKAAEAKVREISAGRLPSLKLSAAYRRLSNVEPFLIPFGNVVYTIPTSIADNYTSQLTLFQPLFMGFKILSGIDMAEQSAKATGEDYSKDESDLVYNIKNSYWTLYKAILMKKVLDETVDQATAHLNDAKNLLKAGMLTDNDVLKLEVQLSDVLFRQTDADNAVRLATVALNSVLCVPLDSGIEIASSPNIAESNYSGLDKLVEKAIEKRPELKSADYRIKAGEANVTAAQSSWYPQISLIGDYQYSRPNARIFPSVDEFKGTWDAGVNVSLNLWDWMTTAHQTDQAKAQLAQSIDAFGTIKDNITLEVTQNYLNFNQAKKKIEISDLGQKQSAENVRVTEGKFKSGMALSSEVVDAETALITAKVNYSSSIVDYELAKARLDKSIGK
jgi:outer membrane protein